MTTDRLVVLALGDPYMPADAMREGLRALGPAFEVRAHDVEIDDRREVGGLREVLGSTTSVAASLAGDEHVLLVHAAPVTAELLDAHPHLRLIACVRGGPSNVDVAAARERGILVLRTPGKNADSVADLTLTFVQLLLRGTLPARDWLRDEAAAGTVHIDSTFSGADWLGREPRGATLGLVGFGAIGRRVARLATAFGMTVVATDPIATDGGPEVELLPLAGLLERSDVVSLHAPVTPETRGIANASFFAAMRPGGFLVNTAREQLVDEPALLAALESGHLAGAALDVFEPAGLWPRLVRRPGVVVTPHTGGATRQTRERGMAMIVADLERFAAGTTPVHAI